MRAVVTLAVLLGTAVGSTTLSAQSSNDRNICFSIGTKEYEILERVPAQASACTRLIPRSSGKELAAVYAARGSLYTKLDRLDDAMADLNKAVDINPSNVEFYDYRADIWLKKGNLDQALANYKMSIRVDPKYPAAYYGEGQVYEKMGQAQQARASYNAALAAPARERIGEWAHVVARKRLKEMDEAKN